ncbi:MAG: hypothetical protein KF701_04405 [Anaerolineales bacterium]|nr:MAG: hypothetical protein KF701_04405 [Anaerolineales bacterium]
MRTFALLLTALVLTACNYPGTPGVVTPPTPLPSATPAPTEVPRVLPHALYFLSQREGSAAIWRLAADGVSLQQLTDESEPVDEYDVAADGTLVYRIQNRIYRYDPSGTPQTLVDNASADATDASFAYTDAVRAPRLAPNGATLAYAQGGVWLFDLASGNSLLILENMIDYEDDAITPQRLYAPVAWSPSGLQLLISIATPDGSGLGVWDVRSEEFVRLQGGAVLCCQAAWAADSQSLLLASAALGLVEPGLWRFDAATGEATTLIETQAEDAYHFVGWPLQLPNGDLQYFYASAGEIHDADLPLYMVRSAADGAGGRSQMRDDTFSIREALWAPDGSLALVAQSATSGAGPIVLAYADGRPLQVLVDFGYELKWGE